MILNENILADYFQDDMVFPRNKKFSIWGYVRPKSTVKVNFQNQDFVIQADSTGFWKKDFLPIDYLMHRSLIVKNDQRIQKINNLKLGKVYLLSGQSNIEFRLKDDADYSEAKELLKKKKYQDLYFYNVPQVEYIDPNTKETSPAWVKKEHWQCLTPDNCDLISDVGYWMLVQLRDEGVSGPIAIVDCFKGGTSASVWIPKQDLEKQPTLKNVYIDSYQKAVANKTEKDFEIENSLYQQKVERYNLRFNQLKKDNPESTTDYVKSKIGDMPWPPPMTPKSFMRPGGLYKTMMSQIKYGSFEMLIWYQGEDDRFYSNTYHQLLPLLINTWRKELNDLSLIVKVVQLPGYEDYPGESGARIRLVQEKVTKEIFNVDLVSFIDGGERHNIHPAHKQKMGRRLGSIVSKNNYSSTPVLNKISIKKNICTLEFSSAYKLLVAKPTYFVEIDDRGNTHKLRITIENILRNEVIVKLELPNSIYLEYGNKNYPTEIGLFNEIGYPVSPFVLKIKDSENNERQY